MNSRRPTVNLVLGFHNHQPIGNFDSVFEAALDKAYRPLLTTLERFPAVRFALHHSGCLWEWLEEHHPEFIDFIGRLVEHGQVELLGGGFYEPILPAISPNDRRRQLDLMREYLYRRFRVEVRGIWLAERVWEQALVADLADAGVEFLAVDDFHFGLIGLSPERLHGYYLTEDAGRRLALFPIDQRLRYLTPFGQIHEVAAYLESVRYGESSSAEGVILPILDDGEKFGLWPNTEKWVYADGWLDRFSRYLSDPQSAVRCWLPSEILERVPPMGLVYLPSASYQEMGIWALPTQLGRTVERAIRDAEAQGRGAEAKRMFVAGPWRNFLVKYPEAGRLHKRMLWMSRQVCQARQTGQVLATVIEAAHRHVLRAECNCAYWHGVFGGVYLQHMRQALYENLIAAEGLLYQATAPQDATGEAQPIVHRDDVDGDGRDEIVVRAKAATWWLQQKGGMLWGWDLRRVGVNLLSTMARQEELYHDAPVRDDLADDHGGGVAIHEVVRALTPRQKESLVYDWHPRLLGLDHFYRHLAAANDHRLNRVHDEGDFVNGYFTFESVNPLIWRAQRDGRVFRDGQAFDVRVTKTYEFDAHNGGLVYWFEITLLGGDPLGVWYAPEFNLGLFAGPDAKRGYNLGGNRLTPLGAMLEITGSDLCAESHPENLRLRFIIGGQTLAHWRLFPIETISRSERAFELNFQSAVVLPHLWLDLHPNQPARGRIEIRCEPILAS